MPRKKKSEINPLEETLNPMDVIRPEITDTEQYKVEFVSAEDYKKLRDAQTEAIISGTPLDKIIKLNGTGFQSMTVYTFYGVAEAGKTQTCNTLAVECPYDVVWIDGGEDTFDPDRIIEIANARGKDPKDVLSRIHFHKALNATHLEAIVTHIAETYMMFEEKDGEKVRVFKSKKLKTGRVGLIVIDSLTPLYRVQYQGMETLGPRQQALIRVIYALRILAYWMRCVVVVTNQVIANPTMYGAKTVPVGGPTVAHNIDIQIKFRKGEQNLRIATLTGSSNTPLSECTFYITSAGIVEKDESAGEGKRDE